MAAAAGTRETPISSGGAEFMEQIEKLIRDMLATMDPMGKLPEVSQVAERDDNNEIQDDRQNIINFTIEDMARMFGENKQLLSNATCRVYRGWIDVDVDRLINIQQNPIPVAIKEFALTEDMLKERDNLLLVSHENIVKLIGSYTRATGPKRWMHMMFHRQMSSSLVFECQAHGNLEGYLFERSFPMITWRMRIGVLLDISKALIYLHAKGLAHGALKADNVLVDQNIRAKLCDFQTLSQVGDGGAGMIQEDVYQFGVIMLVVLLHKRAVKDYKNKVKSPKVLVDKFKELESRGLIPMPSVKLSRIFEPFSQFALMKVAGHCVANEELQRPTMKNVRTAIKRIRDSFVSS